MGFFDRFFGQRNKAEVTKPVERREIAVGATNGNDVTITFNDKNITFSGD